MSNAVDQLGESRRGRRWLKREVDRRSRCPFCGAYGSRMLNGLASHIRRHIVAKDKKNPEYE